MKLAFKNSCFLRIAWSSHNICLHKHLLLLDIIIIIMYNKQTYQIFPELNLPDFMNMYHGLVVINQVSQQYDYEKMRNMRGQIFRDE